MKTSLSIIIPCFNCSDTLREAVDSCYEQGLREDDFEIVMVDDGSTDETKTLMHTLADEHTNIRLLFHDQNRGGGATRNTGIQAAQGEIIYCLDSDNFFSRQSVPAMLTYLRTFGLDGVAFHERRFFTGTNTQHYETHINALRADSVRLFDIFNSSKTLLDNFFFTKEAYKKTSGYPEHHGFDTQCFEVRFLAAGNTVGIVPGSIFWHRQAMGKKSYFERVYESGAFSLNFYYIFEDIFYLLSPAVRNFVLSYDIFSSTKMGQGNLIGMLSTLYARDETGFFINDYERYLTPEGEATFRHNHPDDSYVLALHHYTAGQYTEACVLFLDYIRTHGESRILYFNCLRCAVGVSGTTKAAIEKVTLETSHQFTLQQQQLNLHQSLGTRIINKLRTYLP